MYLKEIQLRNFKNFPKAKFLFQKGINVILGENDSGKTNVLQAIRLVLDKHMNWYEKEITENMFTETLTNWRGHVIVISLRFSEVDTSKEDQAMLKYISGNQQGEGSLTWFCLPDSLFRKNLSKAKNKIELNAILETISIDNYSTITTCGADANYLDDEVYEKLVGNFESGICNWKEKLDESLFGYVGSDSFNSIDYIKNKLIDFTYIDALRDAVNHMKQRFNPLMTMLRQIEPRINETDKNNIKTLIRGVNNTIGGVEEINKLSDRINGKIIESVGNTYAPDIILRSEQSGEIKDIFRNLKLKSNHDKEFDLESLGLGSTNIIYVALKLMEYSFIKEMDEIQSKFFLLLFEEPEAHLHKHVQMALFEKTGLTADDRVQVIMTTHSDNISAASNISNMNIIKKTKKDSIVMQPFLGLEKEEITHLERYLDVKRSELLFSKSVILVEGDAEEILIPIMVKKCFGVSLDELGISLINIGSVGFENVYKLFHDLRVQKKCAIITDLDTPIDISDTSQQTAHKRGQKRKVKLGEENARNRWVDGFFAEHTFEVDLVKNNISYMESLIDKTYKDPNVINQKKIDIKSPDVKKYGDVALKIASYNKKGWNAILLSEMIDGKFQIPEYILDAIAFAGSEEIKSKQNSISILRHYAEIHQDIGFLESLEQQQIISIGDALVNVKNQYCSAILLMKKCGE